jgi:hypothetical protein
MLSSGNVTIPHRITQRSLISLLQVHCNSLTHSIYYSKNKRVGLARSSPFLLNRAFAAEPSAR